MILTQVNSGQMLHVSDLSLGDHPECREVNADPTGSSWKICLFMEYKEDKQDILKGVGYVIVNGDHVTPCDIVMIM